MSLACALHTLGLLRGTATAATAAAAAPAAAPAMTAWRTRAPQSKKDDPRHAPTLSAQHPNVLFTPSVCLCMCMYVCDFLAASPSPCRLSLHTTRGRGVVRTPAAAPLGGRAKGQLFLPQSRTAAFPATAFWLRKGQREEPQGTGACGTMAKGLFRRSSPLWAP